MEPEFRASGAEGGGLVSWAVTVNARKQAIQLPEMNLIFRFMIIVVQLVSKGL